MMAERIEKFTTDKPCSLTRAVEIADAALARQWEQ